MSVITQTQLKLEGLGENNEPKGRVEDPRLLTGKGRFVDDLHLENEAYLGIVRSPYAHARIKSIDFSKARGSPDFIASLTGADLEKMGVGPLSQFPMQKPANRRHLAVGKAVYAGEAVAAVLSKTKYAVEDLIDSVDVEYEELTPVLTIDQAKSAEPIYKEWGNNAAMATEAKKGDAAKVIASAAHVVHEKMGIARQAGTPIEPRAVLASYDRERDSYLIYSTVQSAQRLQLYLSQELHLPKEKFHARVMDVGGGFGTKGGQSYPENVVACLLSKIAGLPVKWASTRTEDLVETAQGRDEYCEIELACDEDGKITALRANIEADAGVSGTLSVMPGLTLRLLPGAYKIPNLELRATAYITNKGPLGPVRGAGRPEACFFLERAVDIMARKLQVDPLEFRRKSLICPADFPYDNGAGFVYDSGNYPLLLNRLRESDDYNYAVARKNKSLGRKTRADADSGIFGVGICIGVEDTGSQLNETARVVLSKDGMATVYTGSSPHGQGLETSLAQLCASELGLPLEKVKVVYGDTDQIPVGVGTFGSRSIAAGGSAVVDASRKLKADLLLRASNAFAKQSGASGTQISNLELRDGYLVNRDDHGLYTILYQIGEVLGLSGLEELSASSDYKLSQPTFASAAHLCALTFDPESYKIRIDRYLAVDDAGRVVNRKIVDGQIEGGVIHGVGGALLEELTFDEQGHLLTSNFLDYTIPSSIESPDVDIIHVETPSTITLNGARGVGESGTIGAYPVIINALNDALESIGAGFEFNRAPATANAIRAYILERNQKV